MPLTLSLARRSARCHVLSGATVFFLLYVFSGRGGLRPLFERLNHPHGSPLRPDNAIFPPARDGCAPTDGIAIDACVKFPTERLKDVQIVLKTGIAERHQTQAALETYGSCISNLLVVSDLSYQVAGHEVVDIVADLPSSYSAHPDWNTYILQKETLLAGNNVTKSAGGWKLDRFKFLAMVDKAFAVNPEAKWYFFIETDNYVFLDTLFRTLDRLDPDEWLYLGSPSAGSFDRWFAYGGGGLVLSRGLVKKYLKNGMQQISVKYDEMAINDCCGDAVLAYSIYEELGGTRVGSLYPTFSGEDPLTVAINKENWCVPLLSFHRVDAGMMESLWRWERCRPFTEDVVTYSSYLHFGLQALAEDLSLKTGWDNGADDRAEDFDGADMTDCARACELVADCLQFTFRNGSCFMDTSVKIGRSAPATSASGWHLERLIQMGYRAHDLRPATCSPVNWLDPMIMGPNTTVVATL